jgi:hypothetical protein
MFEAGIAAPAAAAVDRVTVIVMRETIAFVAYRIVLAAEVADLFVIHDDALRSVGPPTAIMANEECCPSAGFQPCGDTVGTAATTCHNQFDDSAVNGIPG